jgi:general secretion pathway protein G
MIDQVSLRPAFGTSGGFANVWTQLMLAVRQRSTGKLARTSQQGFTLVEMLVVLGIIALIAALVGPQLIKYLGKAKSETAAVQVGNLTAALDVYYLDNGRYPNTQEGLSALMRAPADAKRWNGPYLRKAEGLLDPWGRPYLYRAPGSHGEFDVFSFGRDGEAGGSGDDRDVVSW